MNSQNSKISDSHGPLLNLSDKIDLERSEKNVYLFNVHLYCTWKNIKSYEKTVNLKYHLQR